ncbi:dienelactone hydrolase family protein [Flavobacterium sp. WW92]|uniref:dienelactone hydrolase family protein n=1 Tax=unclassified Flavobacterium TaxID=196869 RepID=UPI002225924E|nr:MULTISPECIES: dienelactone hydrolase family protein [unclassified Flavobacterium]WDO12199.1 dienelactone hydrolase family protein [Flavobacterium sp. WW92]
MTRNLIILSIMVANTAVAQLKKVDYKDNTQVLSGISVTPKKAMANKPGVLILPAWKGIDEHSQEVATELAAMGYYVFVADIYGVDKRPKDGKEAGEKSSYYKTNITEYQKRISLALAELVKQGANAENIAVIGYCFGGTGALEAARVNMKVKGVVSFHGGLSRDASREIKAIAPKVLVLHGADDPYVSEKDIKDFQNEMRTAKADWQMNYYADAVHAFTEKSAGNDNSKGAAYNELADKRSWEAMKLFFKEILK